MATARPDFSGDALMNFYSCPSVLKINLDVSRLFFGII